jgi:hypothetical protein
LLTVRTNQRRALPLFTAPTATTAAAAGAAADRVDVLPIRRSPPARRASLYEQVITRRE